MPRGKQGSDGEPGPSFWDHRVSTPLWGLGIKLHPLKKGHKHQWPEDGEAASRVSLAPRALQGLAAGCWKALLSLWKPLPGYG